MFGGAKSSEYHITPVRSLDESFYDPTLFATAEHGLIPNTGVPVIYYEELYYRVTMTVDDILTYEGGYLYMKTPTKVFIDNWTIPKKIATADLTSAFKLALENKIGKSRNINNIMLYRVDREGLNRYLRNHPEQNRPLHVDTVYGVKKLTEGIDSIGDDYLLVAFDTIRNPIGNIMMI